MSKRAPKLKFTKEELADPAIEKAAKKANRRVRKLEQAEEKIPKKKVTEQVAKDAQGKKKSSPRIHFEEKKPPSKLKHSVEVAPVELAIVQFHRQAGKQEQDNVGTESAHRTEETAEVGIRRAAASRRSRKLRPYRKAAQAERKADRANLQALNTQAKRTGGFSSNP